MATVQDVLEHKQSDQVFRIHPRATVLAAAREMNAQRIGALVVTENDQVVGMFTERDVLRRVVAEGKDPLKTLVGDVMTTDVLFCLPDQSVDAVAGLMKAHRVRHLPVVGTSGLAGLISIGDINAYHATSQAQTIEYLHEYMYGRR